MNYNGLIQIYIGQFNKHGESALKTICNLTVPSKIILSAYKKLTPIEDLPTKEKNELWEYAKQMYPDGDKETRMRFIKITHTIGHLL